MSEIIKGHITRVRYRGENNFCIAGFCLDSKENTSILGNLIDPYDGQELELVGSWSVHDEYGKQFKFTSIKDTKLQTAAAIEKYLAYGPIRGIGEVYAKNIVAKFGKDTLDIIENFPDRLSEVDGIAKKRAMMIVEGYNKYKLQRELMLDLFSYGISYLFYNRVVKFYGEDANKIIKDNPYRLAEDIDGIGFLKADKIAENTGIEKTDPKRIKAGFKYVLSDATKMGHVYLPQSKLIEDTKKLLELDIDILPQFFELEKNDRLIVDGINRIATEGDRVYLYNNLYMENKVIEYIKKLNCQSRFNYDSNLDIKKYNLIDEQLNAVQSILNGGIHIVTGSAGCGKTFLIKVLKDLIKDDFVLLAPTGRAAKRISEVTGHDALTIHRYLGASKHGWKFSENNKVQEKVLIVDEASMIDIPLFYRLLSALNYGTSVIMFGDPYQLPAVGIGDILHDMIKSGIIKVHKLETIHRQANLSSIITVANNVKNSYFSFKELGDDVEFVSVPDAVDVMDKIIHVYDNLLFLGYKKNEIHIISPIHRSDTGVQYINENMQKYLNPNGKKIFSTIFRIDDKVMIIKNNYNKMLFNGDIGYIKSTIDTDDKKCVVIDVENELYEYELDELLDIQLAYASTVHKYQGNEAKVIIFPITTQHYFGLNKNLFYTAITRAKKKLILIGQSKAIFMAVKKTEQTVRYSYLSQKLALEVS